jgi:DtxR family Mn-dependent transcriptional regulator
MISASVEEYLEAVYKLAVEEHPVALGTLAGRLEVSPVSVNEMVKKLVERGLARYEPYKGVSLTLAGKDHALTVIRRHRLWERLLTDTLGVPWDLVHEEACRLEHATSLLVEERLEQYLQEPKTCPHGHPVPTARREMVAPGGCALTDLRPGQVGVVISVPEEEPELLQYLASLGLEPQVTVRVEAVAPFEGPLTVRVGETLHALGRDLASQILVQRA